MADAITQARRAGYTDQEIFAHLTKGREKELDQARSAGYNDSQILNFFLSNSSDKVTGVSDQELTARKVDKARSDSETENLVSQVNYNPASNSSDLQNVLAGAGKAFVDTGRGIKQIVSGSPELDREIESDRELAAPLMRTAAGTLGNVAGGVAQAVPTAFIPGVNTLVGAGLTGAALGAAQPVIGDESRAANATIGGLAGIAGPVLARGTGAAIRGSKALFEPFTVAGRERIAGRTLERFGVRPEDVADLSSAPTSTGARPTLAEQIQRPEGAEAAARLQDAIKTINPDVGSQMGAREGANNAARVKLLESQAAGRKVAADMRGQTAGPLYESANSQIIDPAKLSPKDSAEFARLMQTPAIRNAMTDASEVIANKGGNIQANSIEALHEAKLAIDARISKLTAGNPNAAQMSDAMGLKSAQSRLVKFIESQSPDYAKARASYAELSKPVNQADIAGELLKRGTTSTTDLAGNNVLQGGKITNAMRDQGQVIKAATGRDLGDDLSKVMTPQQMADINAVVGEVDRAGAVARAGNGKGSATAQRLSGTNILEQMTKGTGLPGSTASSTFFQEALSRPLSFLYKGTAEPQIQMTLGQIILNPALASKAMAAANASQRTALARLLANPELKAAARAVIPAEQKANAR